MACPHVHTGKCEELVEITDPDDSTKTIKVKCGCTARNCG